MDKIIKVILDFIANRPVKLAFGALVITFVLIAGAIAITSVDYQTGQWQIHIHEDYELAFVIAYFIIFIASWFILYLLNSKDATDVYSEVRELLKGGWVVTYEESQGPVSTTVIAPRRTTACMIAINPDNLKLELVFQVKDNPIFRDEERQLIRDVGFRYNEEGGYTMMYYLAGERMLRPEISSLIISEGKSGEIDIEIFGRVQFARPAKGNSVEYMSGHWYDLNGNISRLFALLDMKKVSEITKTAFTPLRLSEVPIHPKYFDADMGEVSFHRINP
jgi:hypothetical protein